MAERHDPSASSRAQDFLGRADKLLFLVFFLLGVGGLVLLKWRDAAQLEVTGWPSLILILYAVFASSTKRFRLRADQIGDNCYYLGLLFTLMSLSYSLYEFETGASGTNEIITNFGIALATTIIGLFLRVFLNQFRVGPIDTENAARLELAEAASRMEAQLSSLTLEFNSYTRSLRQSVDEAMSTATNQSISAIAECVEQFRDATRTAVDGLVTTSGSAEGAIRKLDNAAAGMAQSVEDVATRIRGIEVPGNLITAAIEPVTQELEKLVRGLADGRTATQNTMDGLSQGLTAVGESAKELAQTVSSTAGGSADLGRRLGTLQNDVGDVSSKLRELTAGIDGYVAAIKKYSTDLDEELQHSKDATLKVQGALANMVEIITRKLGN